MKAKFRAPGLERSLRASLDAVGNSKIPITKTELWKYALAMKGAGRRMPPEVREDGELKRIRVPSFLGLSSEEYLGILKFLKRGQTEVDSHLGTGIDGGWLFFYVEPPVIGPTASARLLLVGTKAEIRELHKEVEGIRTGESPRRLPPRINKGYLQERKVNYSATAGGFWENFFNEAKFLDVPNPTVPQEMITTGYMRNYDATGAGMTIPVKDRVEQIAAKFGIPIEFIESFCV